MTGVEMLEFIIRLLFKVKLRFCDGEVYPPATNPIRQKNKSSRILFVIFTDDFIIIQKMEV